MSGPPDKIRELIETFERNLDHYKDGKYNETQLRIEFLDPFFTALGWDINNKQPSRVRCADRRVRKT